jgi:hypothetical protein
VHVLSILSVIHRPGNHPSLRYILHTNIFYVKVSFMSERHQVLVEQTGKIVDFAPVPDSTDMDTTREYMTSRDGRRPASTRFIEDEAYKQALSGLVIKCVDIVIYDPATGRVLVGERDQEPQRGDWVIGGRMRAGETAHEAAIRNLRRELGDRVANEASERLEPIGTEYDMVWDTREQDPTLNEDGETVTIAHMSSSPMALPMSEAEFNSIAKPNEEYAGLRWEDGFELYEAPAGTYHPAHQAMVFDTLERVATHPAESALR